MSFLSICNCHSLYSSAWQRAALSPHSLREAMRSFSGLRLPPATPGWMLGNIDSIEAGTHSSDHNPAAASRRCGTNIFKPALPPKWQHTMSCFCLNLYLGNPPDSCLRALGPFQVVNFAMSEYVVLVNLLVSEVKGLPWKTCKPSFHQ